MYQTTEAGYDTYLRKRQNIIRRMDELDTVLDIEPEMSRADYDFMVQVYAGEHVGEEFTEKDLARKIAEDQTYYMTKAQANSVLTVVENYQKMIGTSAEELETITMEDLLYGKEKAIEMKDRYWGKVDEYYHALRDSGVSSTDAKKIIAQTIFGSEEI